MTPLSSSSTPMAAERVRWRKTTSPMRSRSSALARTAPADEMTEPCGNATSTKERLRIAIHRWHSCESELMRPIR